jgi:hypothetical protein
MVLEYVDELLIKDYSCARATRVCTVVGVALSINAKMEIRDDLAPERVA